MKDEYDFSKGVKNPIAKKRQRQQITIRVDSEAIQYFKDMAEELGVPYQQLMNLFLVSCSQSGKKLKNQWDD